MCSSDLARRRDLEHTIDLLKGRLVAQERRAECAEEVAADLRGKLAGVLGSASWRATKPLRSLRWAQRPEAE